MCLGVPGEVIGIEDNNELKTLRVRIGGVIREVISALDKVEVGDYVIVHAGVAISKISREEAEETLRLLAEISGI
ncbi:HypC/HybG/HupF family hydrogenase formation chaperone [Desulfurococcus amylolyticus]|uniref:Hydrogenase assembly chaperone hypC/hupF n=1 Tax=Desulfurococcus amylolyticus (strain DSM 18924 / JCM 16383 / VKM B-2413 / 1221n) TaxID=490899 RepID=B8D3R6_DESA1|nr:HypC/HybG/HupF family hydrogenase formation chaperone [Desulfurococcus amylolyticus]ACL10747.1 hydrogenase assembly chaperone hypC/hupF [Desulfurococcus amylolyticus 1221n]